MVTLNIPDNPELIRELEAIAAQQGISLESLIQQLLEDYISNRISRRRDPIVGIFDSGQDDVVERLEDLLGGWQPD